MKIYRFYNGLDKYLPPGKALILFGPRQVGKTTMLRDYLGTTKLKYKLETGDNILAHAMLSEANLPNLREYVAGIELLAIDEAQKIPNIGVVIKLLLDEIPDIRIIATGSSSFDLLGQIGEPLTGRKNTLTLFPIAMLELAEDNNKYDLKTKLSEYLLYGCYPEVVTASNTLSKREQIVEIMQSYLLKDVLELEKIRASKVILDLLRMLAFQIGNLVSLTEIGTALSLDSKTVAKYLDILERSFVIFNLRGFSKNLRKEINKKSKYYFYDTGIRNALIANFNSLESRNDVGQLFENFIIMERFKKQQYQRIYANNYFWRTWEQQEIDLIEERNGKLYGFEIKWQNKKVKAPSAWLDSYSEAEFKVINRDNYLEFIT